MLTVAVYEAVADAASDRRYNKYIRTVNNDDDDDDDDDAEQYCPSQQCNNHR